MKRHLGLWTEENITLINIYLTHGKGECWDANDIYVDIINNLDRT